MTSDQIQRENSDPGLPGSWQEVNLPVRPGELVRARGSLWHVRELRSFPEGALVRLIGAGRDNRGAARTLLWPFDRLIQASGSQDPRPTSRRRWMNALLAQLIRGTAFGGLRSAAAAKIDLLDWQLEPALASVRDLAPRMLLADEVGLGKTIQAGLILAELLARGRISRAIILTPPGLRNQWADELAVRFGVDATVVDAAALRRQVAVLPSGMNPWAVWRVAIASLDFVKRPEVLRGLTSLLWDLLVVDEAHQTATARDRGVAVDALGTLARRVVLLTATPHAGDADPFGALCDTGRLAGEEPVVMFRRTRQDVGLSVTRRVRLLAVRPTAAERHAHHLLDAYTGRVWSETASEGDGDARLAMIVLQKRALSSMASLASSLEHRLSWLSGHRAGVSGQLPLPLADPEDAGDKQADDDEPQADLRAPGLTDTTTELELLAGVLEASRVAATGESKLAALTRLLRRAGEPAIVFTEYRDTLSRIANELGPQVPIATLHGGQTRAERLAAERSFTAGPAQVLLATDVGGQGLNLHRRCRLVINVELPWSPVRVEQRIGRADRIGQRHRVHAVHLVASGTGEERILARLVARIGRARESIGAMNDPIGSMAERQIEAAMMGPTSESAASSTPSDLVNEASKQVAREPGGTARARPVAHTGLPSPSAAHFATLELRGDARLEVERLQWLRRALDAGHRCRLRSRSSGPEEQDHPDDAGGGPGAEGPLVAAVSVARLRRRHHRDDLQLPEGVAVLFLSRVADGGGGLAEERLVPVFAPLHCPRNPGHHILKELIAVRLAPLLPALRQRAAAEASARLREIERARGEAPKSERQREAAIARAVEGSHAAACHRPVQQGLFDRRALAEAGRLRREWQPLGEEAAMRLAELTLMSDLFLVGEPELVLALAITP